MKFLINAWILALIAGQAEATGCDLIAPEVILSNGGACGKTTAKIIFTLCSDLPGDADIKLTIPGSADTSLIAVKKLEGITGDLELTQENSADVSRRLLAPQNLSTTLPKKRRLTRRLGETFAETGDYHPSVFFHKALKNNKALYEKLKVQIATPATSPTLLLVSPKGAGGRFYNPFGQIAKSRFTGDKWIGYAVTDCDRGGLKTTDDGRMVPKFYGFLCPQGNHPDGVMCNAGGDTLNPYCTKHPTFDSNPLEEKDGGLCGIKHGRCKGSANPICNEKTGVCGPSHVTFPLPDYITTKEQKNYFPIVNAYSYSDLGMPPKDAAGDTAFKLRQTPFTLAVTIMVGLDAKPGWNFGCDKGASHYGTFSHPGNCWQQIASHSWTGGGNSGHFRLMLRHWDNKNHVVIFSDDIMRARMAGLCTGIDRGKCGLKSCSHEPSSGKYPIGFGVPISGCAISDKPTRIEVKRTAEGLYTFKQNGRITGTCQVPQAKYDEKGKDIYCPSQHPNIVNQCSQTVPLDMHCPAQNPLFFNPIYPAPAEDGCSPSKLGGACSMCGAGPPAMGKFGKEANPYPSRYGEGLEFRIGTSMFDVQFPFRGNIINGQISTPIPGVVPSKDYDYEGVQDTVAVAGFNAGRKVIEAGGTAVAAADAATAATIAAGGTYYDIIAAASSAAVSATTAAGGSAEDASKAAFAATLKAKANSSEAIAAAGWGYGASCGATTDAVGIPGAAAAAAAAASAVASTAGLSGTAVVAASAAAAGAAITTYGGSPAEAGATAANTTTAAGGSQTDAIAAASAAASVAKIARGGTPLAAGTAAGAACTAAGGSAAVCGAIAGKTATAAGGTAADAGAAAAAVAVAAGATPAVAGVAASAATITAGGSNATAITAAGAAANEAATAGGFNPADVGASTATAIIVAGGTSLDAMVAAAAAASAATVAEGGDADAAGKAAGQATFAAGGTEPQAGSAAGAAAFAATPAGTDAVVAATLAATKIGAGFNAFPGAIAAGVFAGAAAAAAVTEGGGTLEEAAVAGAAAAVKAAIQKNKQLTSTNDVNLARVNGAPTASGTRVVIHLSGLQNPSTSGFTEDWDISTVDAGGKVIHKVLSSVPVMDSNRIRLVTMHTGCGCDCTGQTSNAECRVS